jgi:HEAT repeat protein
VRLRSSPNERRTATVLRSCLKRRLGRLIESGALEGPFPEPRTDLRLEALASDRRYLVRRVVAQCASESSNPKVKSLLLRLASDANAEVRVAATESLGSLLEGQDCPPSLFKRLRDRSPLVRIAAVAALGQIGDKRALGHLLAALKDSSPLVRSYSAAAVGRLGESAVHAELSRLTASEKSPTAKLGIFDGLHAAGGTPAAIEGLLRLLTNNDYRVRCAAANTLARFRLSSARRAQVRDTIHRALRAEATPAGREALQRALRRMLGSR